MTLLRSIATVGGYTFASRILGFIRDMLIAAVVGAGPVADAFFVAFKLPNLFRRLFAEGAFNAAFVPLFAGHLEGEGRERARRFAEQGFAVLLWALLILVIVFEIAMPWAMMVFAPGFIETPERFELAVSFARIAFPYLLFISLVSLQAGVLNALGHFGAAAATPILLNLSLIAAVLGLARLTPTPGHALAWGVAAAGVFQFLWLTWHCRRAGMFLRLVRPAWGEDVRLLIKRILPGAVGAGVYQLNLLIDTMIASLLPAGSISYLFYADRVNQLPLGVVGVAVGTALLPVLARQLRAGESEAAMHNQNRALEFTLLLTVPAAVALAVIAHPVIKTLFERGAFGPAETAATAWALAVYALGLPAYVLAKALSPGFFARSDTKTPVQIGVVCLILNAALALALMVPFKHVGIAAATAVTAWVNAGLLAHRLRKRGGLALDARLRQRVPRLVLASVVMGLALGLAQWGLLPWIDGSGLRRGAALAMLVIGGGAVFAGLAAALGVATLADLRGFLRKA